MTKLPEAIDAVKKTVTDTLNRALPGLNEMTAYLTQAMGKGARAKLLLTAAMDPEQNVPDSAIKAAAAIEILHMATLVHDDVIDAAPLRRGIETVQQKFGQKRAVICGDYLLCMSVSLLTTIEYTEDRKDYALVPRVSRALSHICRGEYLQYQNNGNMDLDMFTYLKIISGKTAALFYISASIGGLLGGEDEQNIRMLGRFGQYLGLVFQIIDDCKDYEFNEAAAQKSVGNDLVGGVVTLPLIMALRNEPALRRMAGDALSMKAVIPDLIQEVRRVGGPDGSRAVAQRYMAKANQALKGISGIKKESLTALLNKTMSAAAQF